MDFWKLTNSCCCEVEIVNQRPTMAGIIVVGEEPIIPLQDDHPTFQ